LAQAQATLASAQHTARLNCKSSEMWSMSVSRPSSGASVRSASAGGCAQPKASFAAAAQVAIKGASNRPAGLPALSRSAAANLSKAVVASAEKSLSAKASARNRAAPSPAAARAAAMHRGALSSAGAKAAAIKRNSSLPAGQKIVSAGPLQKRQSMPSTMQEKAREPLQPFSMADAEKLLKAVKPAELAALANSSDAMEQTPACMMLDYVGDDNVSWSNAQASLLKGSSFLKEILGMNGDRFITRRALERLEKLGHLDLASLQKKSHAAFAMAAYLDACMSAARERLGINASATLPESVATDAPVLWPMKVSFKDINGKAAEAARWGKTALFVCNGHAGDVDTYFAYRGGGCTSIDATEILNQVVVSKVKTAEQVRRDMHRRVQDSMIYGRALAISMGRTALDFQGQYCGKDELTTSIFKNSLLKAENPDMQPGFYTFVTTDFDLESAREYLAKALPHFDDMAIIEVDAASFEE